MSYLAIYLSVIAVLLLFVTAVSAVLAVRELVSIRRMLADAPVVPMPVPPVPARFTPEIKDDQRTMWDDDPEDDNMEVTDPAATAAIERSWKGRGTL